MRIKLSLMAVCLAILFTIIPLTAGAQDQVRVLENRHTAHFSDKMAFHLVAESDVAIVNVTLYYRRQSERVTSRVVPQFTPGQRVEATYEKDLDRGEIPPGTSMEYYWRLDLADGTHYDTGSETFVYEDDRFPWQSVQAGNVTILYTGGDGEAALARDLVDRGQTTLARLQAEAGVTLDKAVRIYVYRNAEDMAAALSPRSQGFDERILTLGVAVADDALLLLGDHPDIRQTLAHELSHIVLGLATKNPYAPLPRWLDEGLAMYAEGELPPDNARALQAAVGRDALISAQSLSGYTGDASQVDLYYGEVYSLVDFMLRTYGREKMSQLLQVFKQGALQDDALQQVYGLTLAALDTQWRQSLGLKARSTLAPAATTEPAAHREERRESPCPLSSLVGVLGLAFAFGARQARLH